MADPSIRDLAFRGLAATLGAPVDLATMVMRPFGYKTPDQQVIGSSECIGKQLEDAGLISSARAPVQEFLASMIVPGPDDLYRAAAMAPALIGSIKGVGKSGKILPYIEKANEYGISKSSTPVKNIESSMNEISNLSGQDISFIRSNSGATGYFTRGGEVIKTITAPEIGYSKIPSNKEDVLSILNKKAQDRYDNELLSFVEKRDKAKAAKARNLAINEETNLLKAAYIDNKGLINSIHNNENLQFTPIGNEAFNAKSAQQIYKSPSYGGKAGSEYRLIMVNGKPAYARQSDHWGKFSSRSSDDFEKWNDHNWDLPGSERGERLTGYILLEDLK